MEELQVYYDDAVSAKGRSIDDLIWEKNLQIRSSMSLPCTLVVPGISTALLLNRYLTVKQFTPVK